MPGAGRTHGPPAEKNAGGRNHRFSRDIPAFPARWLDGLYVLSPGTGLSCPRHPRNAKALSRAWPQHREARTIRFRRRIGSFVCMTRSRCETVAPTASRTRRFVTIAKRPSWRGRIRAVNHDFGKKETGIFFMRGLDRGDVIGAAREMSFRAHAIRLRPSLRGRIAAGSTPRARRLRQPESPGGHSR